MVGVEPTEVLLRGSEIRRENHLGWCIKPSLKTWDLLPTSTGEFAKNPEPSTNYELMAAEKTPVKGGIAVIVDRSGFEGIVNTGVLGVLVVQNGKLQNCILYITIYM